MLLMMSMTIGTFVLVYPRMAEEEETSDGAKYFILILSAVVLVRVKSARAIGQPISSESSKR
jgi:hypothetical protein